MTAISITIGVWTRCRSCNAEIIWANTPNGKVGPFELDAAGAWAIEQGKARHVGVAQLELGAIQRAGFTSHFATCPQADEWRRSR